MTRAESFKVFLKHFSEEPLPVTLSDEIVRHFSESNPPLDADSIRRYIDPNPIEEDEDITEYIACCRIPNTKDFEAVVYWKGTLLTYEYVLATYSKAGIQIAKKVIAGIKADGQNVKRSVATIEEDFGIQIVVGQQGANDRLYDPSLSQSMSMDILSNGDIALSPSEES
ncbi:MAG: hypothetical protein ACI9FN_000929 [Saprospiraceae bacterium]|jgi:hypothetical protein